MRNTSLTITTQRTIELDSDQRDAIVALCTAAHEHDFSLLFSFLPPEGLHVLGYLGDILVSQAVLTTRWLQPEGTPLLRAGYVDAVATAPTSQGRGFGSAVMRHLAHVADQENYQIACLETERVSFYTRLGWEEWRGPLAGRGEQGLIPTPDQRGVLTLRLPRTPPLDLDTLLTIEDQGARIW